MKSFSQVAAKRKTITCPSNSLNDTDNLGKYWKVFLAGPIQGAPNWQHSIETLFMNEQQNNKIIFFISKKIKL